MSVFQSCPDCGVTQPPCPGKVRAVVGCYWWDAEVDVRKPGLYVDYESVECDCGCTLSQKQNILWDD